MTPADAERFLSQFAMTEEQLESARSLVGKDLSSGNRIVVTRHDPTRRLWLAAAHILGASFRQLARLHGVQPATIVQAISKLLPVETRDAQRFTREVSHEKLSAYRATYVANASSLQGLTPRECAQFILNNTEDD